ncbi:nicotinic acid mononucleotide adenylyltransferase, NAD(P)-requiring [Pseudoalteromonas luteoviolacea B = ATCC 29581]|nr:nicotinic acid mononucleotide adenylyltransferase, NAD(P)-requiring [Pseudoalteromonas luteoviolacea B = ATCC 29581]
MAHQALLQLAADKLYFMPCAVPVHKAAPGVTAAHRVAMLKLVCNENRHFAVDERELTRTTPSYSHLSMEEIRQAYPNEPIVFLIGMDSFNQLHTWFKWQALTSLCHIAVFARPGESPSLVEPLQSYLAQAKTENTDVLHQTLGGHCVFLKGPVIDAASSKIRNSIKQNQRDNSAIPDAVIHYITTHNLYTDNASLT